LTSDWDETRVNKRTESGQTMVTQDQRHRYESARQMAKEELDRLDKELAEEIFRAKQRIEELQQAKKAVKQIYDGACALLGIKSVIEIKDYALPEIERQA
jgi:hypothetical protein